MVLYDLTHISFSIQAHLYKYLNVYEWVGYEYACMYMDVIM